MQKSEKVVKFPASTAARMRALDSNMKALADRMEAFHAGQQAGMEAERRASDGMYDRVMREVWVWRVIAIAQGLAFIVMVIA